MYFGVLHPYVKSDAIGYCPKLGVTDWASVMNNPGTYGITPPANGYQKADEGYYIHTLSQMALNEYILDFGLPVSANWGPYDANNRPTAPKGRLGMIARPASVIMFIAESAWDWNSSRTAGLGNGLTWPSANDQDCDHYWQEGFTEYPHKGASGPTSTPPGYPNNQEAYNPNLRGYASFAFCDGHAHAMKFSQAESCVAAPQPFVTGSGGFSMAWPKYYPYWTPDF